MRIATLKIIAYQLTELANCSAFKEEALSSLLQNPAIAYFFVKPHFRANF